MNESSVVVVVLIIVFYLLLKRELMYTTRDVSSFSLAVRLILMGIAMALYILALLRLFFYLNPEQLPALLLPVWALGWASIIALIFRTGRRIKKGQRNAGQ